MVVLLILRWMPRSTDDGHSSGADKQGVQEQQSLTTFRSTYMSLRSIATSYLAEIESTAQVSKFGGFPLNSFHDVNSRMRYLFMVLTGIAVFILMPTFGCLSIYESTHRDTYVWSLSAIMLSGKASGIVLWVLFFCLIVFFFYIFLSKIIGAYASAAESNHGRPKDKSSVEYAIDIVASLVIGVLNFAIMVLIDAAYVLSVLNENGMRVVVIQIGLSVFKLCWNEMVLWQLYPIVKRMAVYTLRPSAFVHPTDGEVVVPSSSPSMLLCDELKTTSVVPNDVIELVRMSANEDNLDHHLSISPTEVRSRVNSTRSVSSTMISEEEGDVTAAVYHFSRYEVGYLVFTVIMNNVIIPCIAIAVVSPDCFYNAFFSHPPTEETTVYTCGIYALFIDGLCLKYLEMTEFTTFDIPFLYRYQCSVAFVTSFAAVHIFMFLFVGLVLPLSKISLKVIVDHMQADSSLRRWLLWLLPMNLQPLQAERGKKRWVFVEKDKLVVKLSAYLAIVLTFGMLFPPLACIGSIAVFVVTYYEELVIGRLLFMAKEQGFSWYRVITERDCSDIVSSWHAVVWLIVPLAAVAYSYVLFDTIGDRYGWKFALGPVLFLVVLPWVIVLYRQCAVRSGLPMFIPGTFNKGVTGKTFEDVYNDVVVRATSVSLSVSSPSFSISPITSVGSRKAINSRVVRDDSVTTISALHSDKLVD
jgi:hypothetical protein